MDDFYKRFNQLTEKESGKVTIGMFFEMCLNDFKDEKEQRFIRWFRLGFARFTGDILHSSSMMIVFENFYPLWLSSQEDPSITPLNV